MWRTTISFVNAHVHTPAGTARSLRFGGHVLGLDEKPGRHDIVIDLDGAHVLPGLINAHEHLELNHYGRIRFRDNHTNVSQWIDDMRPNLAADPEIAAGRKHPLGHRLFHGALKNLLAGVTTIAHHNPLYREVARFSPVRVIRRFGWAHSFGLEDQPAGARGEPGGNVAARHRATPPTQPFLLHLAEGIDEAAREEFVRLESMGCLTPNTVLIHGVGLTSPDWETVADRGASAIWCPGSNLFLFGRTLDVRALLDDPRLAPQIALGTDSRLSGTRDLLEEMRAARNVAPVSADELLRMVTTSAANVLKLDNAGRIATGWPADLIVVPNHGGSAADSLAHSTRRDLLLVMAGGRPLVGAPTFETVFRERRVTTCPMLIDDNLRLVDAAIARRMERSSIHEPGVSLLSERTRDYALATSR